MAFCNDISENRSQVNHRSYLVSLMGSSRSNLALLAGCEFSEVTVVVALPA